METINSCIKSVWVKPFETEAGAPDKRIIHGKYLKLSNLPGKIRVGIKRGEGYFKCGSGTAYDWVSDFVIYAWRNNVWDKIVYATDLKKPVSGEDIIWFKLPNDTKAFFFEVRKSGIDRLWPCYNLVNTCFIIDVDGDVRNFKRPNRMLHDVVYNPDIEQLSKKGIAVEKTSTAVQYKSRYYAIGFRLKSAGLSFLGLDGTGNGNTCVNMLKMGSLLSTYYEEGTEFFAQGPIIEPVASESICGFKAYEIKGKTEITGNSVKYRIYSEDAGLSYEFMFTMQHDSICVSILKKADRDIKLLDSAALRISFDSKEAPLTALGHMMKRGETGHIELPLTLHLPGYSNIYIDGDQNIVGRFNSIRPMNVNTFDIKMEDILCDDGCYSIQKGEYSGKITLKIGYYNHLELKKDTPETVKNAVERYLCTCLPYRADTGTFSNNGNSMSAPICMDLWGELCKQIDRGEYGLDSFEFLKNTIEINLLGVPTYASGLSTSGENMLEDEYLMSGTAVLLGISIYLAHNTSKQWYEANRGYIAEKIKGMLNRDVDNDGLVESLRRRGVSGEHQWSTCWYDVISYGYKDAFSNALLYPALLSLGNSLEKMGDRELAVELNAWAKKMKAVYTKTFLSGHGWLAGWKSQDGVLHDYGFLAVNGAAASYGLMDKKTALVAIGNLWNSILESGFDSFDLGLPGNVFDVPNSDMAHAQLTLPFGGYQNGGITLSQSRHFINGLYSVGMQEEADYIIHEICNGLMQKQSIGGIGSGGDWRAWDGLACGYEGILTDQFGVFESILKRYKESGMDRIKR